MSESRMTKDQLRDALTEKGVKTNTKLRKAELVKLFRENVLEQTVEAVSLNDSLIGGFSSDEDEPMSVDTSHITHETNLADLTNDEIFFKLKNLGETVGPILDTTRTIYERKLNRILNGNDLDEKDISAFSADEAEVDKDETDEYDIINEDMKTNGSSVEKLRDGDEKIQTETVLHERVEENNGEVVRMRRAQTVRTITSEKVNGKTFVPPPPPKKANILLIGIVVALILVVLVTLLWFNLEAGIAQLRAMRSEGATASPRQEGPSVTN